MQAVVVAKVISGIETLQDPFFLSQGSPVWSNMVGVNHKSHLKRNNIKSASADLDGSTKSCNQVQNFITK